MGDAERLVSLRHGTDQDCLRDLLGLHAVPQPVILDATWGGGSMWQGLQDEYYPIERLDSRDVPGATALGDFRAMPQAWTERFDVVVFDPPHMAEAGRSSKHGQRYGARQSGLEHAAAISHLFPPFLREARRVLRPNGIVLAKLIDVVHRGHFQFQALEFVNAARLVRGLTPCDYQIKDEPRAYTLTGHNWAVQRHTRRSHVFWFVVRKGGCYRPDAARVAACGAVRQARRGAS